MPGPFWNHRIDQFVFQFWEGEPPHAPTQAVEVFTRAGVAGTGQRLLAARGAPFEVQLTEHFASFLLAIPMISQYETLIGADPVEVWWEHLRQLPLIRTKFAVLAVRRVSLEASVRLMGPGYNFAGGAALTTRWQLLPIAV